MSRDIDPPYVYRWGGDRPHPADPPRTEEKTMTESKGTMTIHVGPEMRAMLLVQRLETHMSQLNTLDKKLNAAFKTGDPKQVHAALGFVKTEAHRVAALFDQLDTTLFVPAPPQVEESAGA